MKIKIGLLALGVMLSAAAYYYVFDGSLPEQSNYKLDIAEVRAMADGPQDALPTEIRMEVLARNPVPYLAMRAGGGFGEVHMARTSFQIVTPDGHYVLEAGMDRALAEDHDQAEGFDEGVWQRLQATLSSAKGILVSHEHPDHIGGIARHRDPGSLAGKLVLTVEQFEGLGEMFTDGRMPAALSNYKPLQPAQMHPVAPGIVMIRANGHSPGSIFLFVHLKNGSEYLFIGDVAFTESNVVDGVDRPRFVRFLMVHKEDRNAVINQLKTIHELSKAEPELRIVPAHADKLFTRMVREGALRYGFLSVSSKR